MQDEIDKLKKELAKANLLIVGLEMAATAREHFAFNTIRELHRRYAQTKKQLVHRNWQLAIAIAGHTFILLYQAFKL